MLKHSLAVLGLAALLSSCGGSTPPAPPVYAEAPAPERIEESPPAGRLPSHTQPLRYGLELEIVPETGRFTGKVRIDVRVAEPREVLWLHGLGFDVSTALLSREGADPVEVTYEQVTSDGVVALRASAPIEPGQVQLTFEYSAALGSALRGLYRVDSGGKAFAFTQLEPVGARAVFPCFDEPAFKTPFDVRLRVKREHVAIANTAEVSRKDVEGGLREITYAPTENLPTYLIAFAVGDLEVVEAPPMPANAVRKRPLPFRGVAVKGRGAELAYALKHTPAMLEWLEQYFDRPYPYDKLDVIAVPDFSSGAMENVGAVTFREQLLLIKEDAPERQRRSFAYVMAHELAHMWFGNLVTMPWWDDLWLNEAFATWMGGRVIEKLYPEYESALGHLSRAHYAMGIDQRLSARQIRQPIESNHDIENAFDGITYSKGGAVLAMFERYLTRDTFRDGLRRYMQAHAHGNARAEDLVDALSQASGKDLKGPFFSFLEQPGVPLIQAQLVCADGAASLTVAQSRYLPVGVQGPRDRIWQLPLCVRYESGGEPRETCTMLSEAKGSVALQGAGCPSWVMPNAGAAGYYRWSLQGDALAALTDKAWQSLDVAERVSTAASLNAAMRAGSVPAAVALEALSGAVDGADRHVLSELLGGFGTVEHALLTEAELPRYRAHMGKLVRAHYKKLGLLPKPKEDGNQALLRASVVRVLAFDARDEKVREALAAQGRSMLGLSKRPATLSSDLAPLALKAAVQMDGAPAFEAALKRALESDDALERGRLLGALASTHDPDLAQRARALALDERLKVNELMLPLRTQVRQPETREATWAWLEKNYDALHTRLSPRRAGGLPSLGRGFCTQQRADQVQKFFADRIQGLSGGPRRLADTVETIQQCAALAKAQGASARAFFAK